jgi:hypothetical protein
VICGQISQRLVLCLLASHNCQRRKYHPIPLFIGRPGGVRIFAATQLGLAMYSATDMLNFFGKETLQVRKELHSVLTQLPVFGWFAYIFSPPHTYHWQFDD